MGQWPPGDAVIATATAAGNFSPPGLASAVMAKRLQVNFAKPRVTRVEENGQPRPCATGVVWVNDDTLATLDRLDIRPTDAKGKPLDDK